MVIDHLTPDLWHLFFEPCDTAYGFLSSSRIHQVSLTYEKLLETRWGQGLDPAYFPIQNTLVFSKVKEPRNSISIYHLLNRDPDSICTGTDLCARIAGL